ncbi:MAG: type IV secretory system conjugative DNA transfer family protein [Bdellovibrionales bacterium]
MELFRQEHFYANLSERKEMELLSSQEGFVVGQKDGQLMRLDKTGDPIFTFAWDPWVREDHAAIPNLLDHQGSALSISVGNRVVRETLAYRRDVLKQQIYIFDPYNVTDEHNCSINILDQLEQDHLEHTTQKLARYFLQEEIIEAPSVQKNYDRLYPETKQRDMLMAVELAEDLLNSTFLYLLSADQKEVPPENRNLEHCSSLLSSRDEKLIEYFVTDTGPYKHLLNATGNWFSGKLTHSINTAWLLAASSLESFLGVEGSTNTSSFQLSSLRDAPTTIYVVMPDVQSLAINKRWLRAFIETAEDACPNLTNSPDNHKHIKKDDRILFMIDEVARLGRLTYAELGPHGPLMKGITHWGLTQNPNDLVKVYGKHAEYSRRNNPHMQILDHYSDDFKFTIGTRESEVKELVQKEIIASPPRPKQSHPAKTAPHTKDFI